MLKIRLNRGGRTHRPIYTIVVTDVRNPRDGKFIEKLGKYDPKSEENVLTNVKAEAIAAYVKKGAVMSDTVRTLLKKNKIALQQLKAYNEEAFKKSGVLLSKSQARVDMSELKELIQYVSKALVDMPDEVTVNEIVGEQTTVVELKVDKSDLGKVIGKQGRTARALRTILNAASTKLKKRSVLEIIE